MMRKKSIKSETTHNGTLCTPVVFYQMKVSDDFYTSEQVYKKVYESWAEVYNPSNKDLEIMKSKGVKSALTIKIRDPLATYQPDNADMVELKDTRTLGKRWNIADIRPDFYNRNYIVILLNGDSYG